MKKSVMGADFEKKDAVPPYSESKRAAKLKRRVSLQSSAPVVLSAKVVSFVTSCPESQKYKFSTANVFKFFAFRASPMLFQIIAIPVFPQTERAKSSGDGWFNMKAPEITQELKGDLQVLKMRGSMDPKRFYKKNDRDGFPKYFQVSRKH